MGRYLIVANQTLGGEELAEKVAVRIEHGEGRFYVVVPLTQPDTEVPNSVPHDPAFGVPPQPEPTDDADEEARRRSEHRLRAMIDKIAELGGEAEGEIGSTDPFKAVQSVVEREDFDEVIVSTLPAGVSRWVKMDLPSRIDRLVDCPVTTVTKG